MTFLQVPTPSNIQPRSPTGNYATSCNSFVYYSLSWPSSFYCVCLVVTFNLSDLSSPDDVFHTPMPPMSSSKDSGWLSRLDAVNSAVSDRHRRSAQRVDKTEAKAIKGPHRISTGGTCYLYAKKRRWVNLVTHLNPCIFFYSLYSYIKGRSLLEATLLRYMGTILTFSYLILIVFNFALVQISYSCPQSASFKLGSNSQAGTERERADWSEGQRCSRSPCRAGGVGSASRQVQFDIVRSSSGADRDKNQPSYTFRVGSRDRVL